MFIVNNSNDISSNSNSSNDISNNSNDYNDNYNNDNSNSNGNGNRAAGGNLDLPRDLAERRGEPVLLLLL